MEGLFQEYFREIREKFVTGDYTEYTHRTAFENFIRKINDKYNLVQEPKRKQKLGAPDFVAYRKGVKIGYIETKDLDTNLDIELESDQITKYKESINNIVLTNYSRFILIRNNEVLIDENLFNLFDLKDSKHKLTIQRINAIVTLFSTFFDYPLPTIKSAKELAIELSKRAKLLKELTKVQLLEDLSDEAPSGIKSSVFDFYEGIKELIKDISVDDCADAYAQTITYGLFLARINCPDKFERKLAATFIPQNIGIIKRIFLNIAGDAIPENVSWIVDDIADILNASKIKDILADIDFRGKKDRDPFTFFYEDFLTLYDPEKKKLMGIYYTPRPVVNYIVNSINYILKKDFGKIHGFNEEDVTVLDPAVGTGTFLWLVFLRTLVDLKDRHLGGLIPEKIEKHILKKFFGFELLITPYIIAHLKLGMILKKWFYDLKDHDRIQVYLTNTLNPTEIHGLLPFLRELTEESRVANEIKINKPILIILGNPPYSVSSSNNSEWILEKMEDYKEGLKERNIQPLNDDYIKFIRFAHWKIEQNKKGIVGFITNNSYLDGIIHRQMRKVLLYSFERIYILNLHGSSRRKETLPAGISKDENVFDIQQGVAIVLFVKNENYQTKRVFYTDLFGSRKDKYKWLDKNLIDKIEWQELDPQPPYYFFIAKDFTHQEEYDKFWKITDIFRKKSSGVKTHRDHFVVGFNQKEILHKLKIFTSSATERAVEERLRLKDTGTWKLKEARVATKRVKIEFSLTHIAHLILDGFVMNLF